MKRGNVRRRRAEDPEVFVRFSRAFPRSAGWRPYFVRWEREARVRFDRVWLVRAEIEVQRAGRAFVRLFLSSPSRRGALLPVGEPGFEQLRSDLESCGYELRAPDSPYGLLMKRFRPTAALLTAAREEVEGRFWPDERSRSTRASGPTSIIGALRYFSRTRTWAPSSCGWSSRFRLRDGTEVALVLLVVQSGRGGRLQPESMVLLYPPKATDRKRVREFGSLCRAAGYEGKLETARPAGREPFLFAHFQRPPISFEKVPAERRRLDELARAFRHLR